MAVEAQVGIDGGGEAELERLQVEAIALRVVGAGLEVGVVRKRRRRKVGDHGNIRVERLHAAPLAGRWAWRRATSRRLVGGGRVSRERGLDLPLVVGGRGGRR